MAENTLSQQVTNMAKKRRFNHKPQTILIDINRVHLGGQYAAMQRAMQQTKQPRIVDAKKSAPDKTQRDEYLERIKQEIKRGVYKWMQIYTNYDSYDFTESEYVEIAKFAIDLYPTQMYRVHYDRLSPNNYYEICKVAAKHGVIQSMRYDYLSKAKIKNVKNPVFDIMKIALDSKNSVGLQIEISQQLKRLGINAENFVKYCGTRER